MCTRGSNLMCTQTVCVTLSFFSPPFLSLLLLLPPLLPPFLPPSPHLRRYSYDADCEMFFAILEGTMPEDVHADQVR